MPTPRASYVFLAALLLPAPLAAKSTSCQLDGFAARPFYYEAQTTNASCSLAVTAMLLKKLFQAHDRRSWQPLIKRRLAGHQWLTYAANDGRGVVLAEFASYLQDTAAAFGARWRVEVVFSDRFADAQQMAAFLRGALAHDNTAVIVNFDQGGFFGDLPGGHYSIVEAISRGHAQLVDPDGEVAPAYGITAAALWRHTRTVDDESGKPRGFILVTALAKAP